MSKKKVSDVLASHNIQQLTDFEHTRKRLEMYLGSRVASEQPVLIFNNKSYEVKPLKWVPSLITSVREIWENSIDEHIKAGTKDPVLKVFYNENELEFEITDNGRGIPIDYDPNTNTHICTMVLTETKTGRNFNDDDRQGTSGMNGLGGSVVMMVSESAELEIHRAGRPYKTDKANDEYDGVYKFTQSFKEGNELLPELQISEPIIRKVKTDKTGTSIHFKLSKSVFPAHDLPLELVYSILKELAAAHPTYKIYLNDERINVKGSVEKGLFGVNNIMTLSVLEDGFNSTFYVVPNAVHGLSKNLHVQGLVNNAPSFDGGTHLDTFQRRFALGVIKALEKESNRKKLYPNRADIEEGLLIYNQTVMDAPYYSSQTKSKLINTNIVKHIEKAMTDEYFSELVKKNKDWVQSIFERCAERTNKKDADEDRKNAKKLLKGKVAKLRDAVGKDRTKCELFITEGDCIHEDTKVLQIKDGVFKETCSRNLEVGDLVLTHKNNIKPIIGKSIKVRETITFETGLGTFEVTPEHRMLICRDNTFMFMEAKDIVSTDSFVKSQLVDIDTIVEIKNILLIDDEKYDAEIILDDGSKIQATLDHTFMVYDSVEHNFKQLSVRELKINTHSMILK